MKGPASQRGFSLPVLLVGSAITLVVFGSIYEVARLARLESRGKTLATSAAVYQNALVAYALAKRTELVSGASVAGVAVAQAPTCAELKALMPALLDYSCSLPESAGMPQLSVTPIPAGCAATACDLAISVTATAALAADEDGSEILQRAVNAFGAEAGQSLVGSGTTIRGTGWSRANPLGDVPRVFGTYATYGASTLSKFVTLYDTRDPMFMGNVSISLNLNVTGTVASMTGISVNTGSGCKAAEMTASGQIIARDASCADRVVTSGASGELETRSATGARQVRLGTGVQLFNASGSDKAGLRFVAGVSEAYADRFVNNTGTASISPDGSVAGTTATFALTQISQAQTPGSACPANSFARSSDGRWLECFGGVWRYTGIHYANAGDACVGGFAQDSSNATAPLICRNNVYVNLNQALGLVALIDSLTVTDGSVVPAPSCASTAAPILMTDLTRFQTPAGGGTLRLSYTGSGPWTIGLTGSGGGEAVVWRGCRYASF